MTHRVLAHSLAEPLERTRLLVVEDGDTLLLARGTVRGPLHVFEIHDVAELRAIAALLVESAEALEPSKRVRVRCRGRRRGAR